jgi:predicted kinase
MADGQPAPPRPVVVVAMKGHPGSGKSTAARAIAAALRCPLLDKDDVRDCTLPLEGMAAAGMLNDLSYAVLWRMAERQVRLGLSVVIDSPLSRRAHLDVLTRLVGALVVVVECRPGDNEEWRRRLEKRGVAVPNGGGDGWHKPKTWAELERLLEGYQGCTDYEIEDVPRIVVDTTDPTVDAQAIAAKVVGFVSSHLACSQSSCETQDSPVCYWKPKCTLT